MNNFSFPELPATPQLNEALAKAKPEFEPIVRDEIAAFNTKAGGRIEFDYADLEDIIPAVVNALSNYGLSVSSQIIPIGGDLYLVSTLRHSSGESIASYFPLPEPGADPKAFGSLVTFGRRYNTLCLLELNTVTDEQSKSKKKEKAANEIRKELNKERAVSTSKPPAKPTTPPVQPPKQLQRGMYPQHMQAVGKIRRYTGHTEEQIETQILFMTGGKHKSPDQLSPNQLPQLLGAMVVGWATQFFPSDEHAEKAYQEQIQKLTREGASLEHAIDDFIYSVQATHQPVEVR